MSNLLDPRRQRAVDMFVAGVPPLEVAKRLSVSQRSVYEWHGRWRRGGVAGLMPRPRPGRPPSHVLSEAQAQRIRCVIAAGPPSGLYWSFRAVRAVAEAVTGRTINVKMLRRWIRGPLGLVRLLKPHRFNLKPKADTPAWLRGGGYAPKLAVCWCIDTRTGQQKPHPIRECT